ncbi:PREDICTED: LEAF RUST 10 DISEASE-RESISTANCE LOCUS RECEPTOR-LIKE PROTEIN KINASE-like 1.2 isoform X1 [Lupinus angustifolius]|uniref:LEAF RUST 10 DISEASE-RESISTANCE LOCUS RECEPTOR-LIKE PROTEIN KINASE-like 1.2 isoform X1 n=1 Tax=Lupinus angustifolius TaxID=3871 RepID=UPI00092F1B8B|nr:PREDICTED: LEAF RUST 10 DISEASE-RESISTANCE LOCUS RECEPTOR-LIKE PROTEIN KINASE-like 1.2 isoform X1 [Lupinus angustifolius]
MNQITLFIPFFFLIVRISFCYVDPKFLACKPMTCGNNQNISYPFYIKDKQEAFCGNPGFELSCNNKGFPILNLIDATYIVQEIFYNNHTLRLSNAVFAESTTSDHCIVQIKKLSVGKYRFYVAPNQSDVLLFYGCDLTSLSEDLRANKIGCSQENKTSSVVASYREDKSLREACKGGVVNVTVEDVEGGIKEALRKGFVLNWNASNCSTCTRSGGRCGFDLNADTYAFRCYCRDRPHAVDCDPDAEAEKLSKAEKLVIGLSVGLVSILIVLLLLLYKRKYGSSGIQFETTNSYSDPSSTPDAENGNVYFGVPLFSYKELEEATSRFDQNKQIGDGGFGTVYYGKLQDGREVAVKRLYQHNYRRVEQFMNEVQILTRLRHKNLVSLYGCTSRQSRELLLVYEYISNGTVASHLHGELAKPGLLPWSIRIKIAIETASALAYLHASEIIHRDVKTNNVLLDSSYCVKVADFGLSRLFPNDVTHVSTAPQGTPGYVDPEYYQCYKLTSKSDVYSFGVMLIELISSQPAVDMDRHKGEINLSSLAIKKIQESKFSELVDPYLGFDSDSEVKRMIISVAELAFQCLQRDKELRPSMNEVLDVLKRIESEKNEPEVHQEEADVYSAGASDCNVHPPLPPKSPEWDQVVKQPSSPITVTDNWESQTTTPNVLQESVMQTCEDVI